METDRTAMGRLSRTLMCLHIQRKLNSQRIRCGHGGGGGVGTKLAEKKEGMLEKWLVGD